MRWLAALTCGGMLLVLVMGAAVTNTGSAEGCGRSWPLCNGQFVPEFTVATAIEYSHRAVTGLESLLVVALSAAMLALWRRDREVVVLTILMLGTLFLQAGLGAGAVLWPQSSLMLATHFGVSLVAFAATFLAATVVFERTSRKASPRPQATGGASPRLALAITLYVLGVVVYLGAYVRHADLSLACVDWPLCNGQVVPPLDNVTGVVFAHRLAALGAVILLGFLAYRDRSTAATWALVLVILQALSGALVVWSRLGLFSTLLHAAIMGLLFAMLTYVVRRSLADARRNDSVPDRYLLSDAAARDVHQPGLDSQPHALATSTAGLSAAAGRGAVDDDADGKRPVGGSAQGRSTEAK
jgi:cytochrome c oxidase assembly protein subunit 15